jgi:hypothetical protein
MEEWAPTFARYNKRPFGLFPEPSAMAASLGPWLVLVAGLLLEPRLRRAIGFDRPWRARAALVGGSSLIVASRSGFMGIYFLSIFLLLLDNLRKAALRYEVPKMLALIGLFAAALVGGVYATCQLTANLDDKVDSSWGYRYASIRMALTSNTDALNLLIGFGPGQSAPILEKTWTGPSYDEEFGNLAVFSLAARHFMEMGLVGTLALAIVLGMVLRSILRSAAVPLGLSALLSWLVAVALTTSYMPLSAIWLFLGAMLSWDDLFPVTDPFAGPSVAVANGTGDSFGDRAHRSGWYPEIRRQ